MSSGATFKTASGGDPVEFILNLKQAARPTEGDAIYTAQRQRTRILDRTQRGVDVNGRPFEPYSEDGPYYYYPNGRVGKSKFAAAQNRSAAKRMLRRIGGVEADIASLPAHLQARIPGINEHGETGAQLTKNGQGIKFDSYAAYKAALGRGCVDLYGPRAPHMLQAIGIRAGDRGYASIGRDENIGPQARPNPVSEFAIGIYGDAAGRASAHNTGKSPRWKRDHKREFFGASAADVRSMISDMAARAMARMRAAFTR